MRIALLAWFELNGRHWIPWKLKQDKSIPTLNENLPVYPIWIAEVMLQQTQLAVVLPYWENWIAEFPSLPDLANALQHDVLLHWQGLGYYSRAKRLHDASKQLLFRINEADHLDPEAWPLTLESWISLPGIGKTTAASIISSAFNAPAALLDGNVKRILSRLIGSQKILSKDSVRLWKLSNLLLDQNAPRHFNQALMDLGATVCTTNSPKCFCCPWKLYCFAYYHGDPTNFPVKGVRKVRKNLVIGIGLIINALGEVLIDQRTNSQTMAGLWEFPGGKKEDGELIEYTIVRELKEELDVDVKLEQKLIEFDHFYTNKKLHFVVYICKLVSGKPKPLSSLQVEWVQPIDLINYPFPAANHKIISALNDYLSL